jgi:succinate-semialdehyde dehydrogenase/glutarate-semialdehyde dehydrogenase
VVWLFYIARVRVQVDDAVAKGARVLAGGRARPDLGPYFYEATLLEGVTPDMAAYDTETFGPVGRVYRSFDIDEALARVNDTAYGLHASVWSRDTRRARSIAARIEAGTVAINERPNGCPPVGHPPAR